MAFILPTFNLTFNYWHRATWGVSLPAVIPPPDLATVPCQLREYHANPGTFQGYFTPFPVSQLLVPKGTDIRFPVQVAGNYWHSFDVVEVPSGSNRWYFMQSVMDAAKGFPNEYRVGWMATGAQFSGPLWTTADPAFPYLPAWPTPYP